jgi:hypothetical protein
MTLVGSLGPRRAAMLPRAVRSLASSSAAPAVKDSSTVAPSSSSNDVVKSLIDEWRHVVGSWSSEQLKTAQDILPNVSPELAFALYHRIMKEMEFSGNISPRNYGSCRTYVPLLQKWRDAYILQYRRRDRDAPDTYDAAIPHPNDVFQMLRTLQNIPGFEVTAVSISLVLSVVVATGTNRAEMPFVLQDLIIANARPDHRQTPHLVGQLMQAWAISGRPYREVSQRLDQLLQSVDRPNVVLFNTAIHFYTRNVEMAKTEALLEQMKKLNIPCNGSTTLNHLAHGYAQAGQLRAAYDALEVMVDLDETTEDNIAGCTIGILDVCRRRVRAARKKQHVSAELEYAEKIYCLIRTRIDGRSRSKTVHTHMSPLCYGSGITDFTVVADQILCMMVDLYGFLGDYNKAERAFLEIDKPDHIMYCTCQ